MDEADRFYNLLVEFNRRNDDQFKANSEAIAALGVALKEMNAAVMPRAEAEQRFNLGKEAVGTALAAAEKAVQMAMMAAEKAVLKSEEAYDKRFQAVNEFRSMVQDVVNTMITRAEADSRLQALSERIEANRIRLDRSEGTGAGLKTGWALLVGLVGIIATIATIFAMYFKRF